MRRRIIWWPPVANTAPVASTAVVVTGRPRGPDHHHRGGGVLLFAVAADSEPDPTLAGLPTRWGRHPGATGVATNVPSGGPTLVSPTLIGPILFGDDHDAHVAGVTSTDPGRRGNRW